MPVRPKVLFISSQVLFRGTRAGGARRLYSLAKGLEEFCELHVICVDGMGEWKAGPVPDPDFPRFLHLPFDFSVPRGEGRIFRSPLDYSDLLGAHAAKLKEFLGDTRFDAALLAYPLALPFLDAIPPETLGRVTYLEDDLLLETYRKRCLGRVGFIRRTLYRLRYRQLLADYRRKLRRASLLVAISREEMEILQGHFPGLPARVFKHALPREEVPCLAPPENLATFGFIANYGHYPNRASLEWLVSRFIPMMKRELPKARLVLAGSNMPADMLSSVQGEDRVEWLGAVEDLKDFYGRFAVSLNPILAGRGLRTKLVEAAAYGRPIVSTRLGAEGLGDLDIRLAESESEFLREAGVLAGDAGRYAEVARANREVFERGYSVETQVRDLWPALIGDKDGVPV